MLRNFFRRGSRIRRIERRPHRSRRDCVDADAAVDKFLCERFRERVDRAFGRRIIRQTFCAEQAGDGARRDDGAAGFHVPQCGSRETEVRVDVRLERVVELRIGHLIERFLAVLMRSVRNEDVQLAERLHRRVA